jgi:hypothetical protein
MMILLMKSLVVYM